MAEPWRDAYEKTAEELVRSERLANQFRQALIPLRQKTEDLEAERQRLRSRVQADEECTRFEGELADAREAAMASEEKLEQLEAATRAQRQAAEQATALAEERDEETTRARSVEAECNLRLEAEELRCAEAQAEARSMVTVDTLERTEADARNVRSQLSEQEAETARLREALADAWAARADDPADACQAAAPSQEDSAALDRMEEELRWLTEVQQSAASETRKLHKLERTEAMLHAELREASEEKAALQSSRIDICDTGRAMREAIAVQSEGYVKRCDDLEDARRTTDADRMKLLQECADLQAKLTAMEPQLESVRELEDRHSTLEGERRAMADESARLREVNGALGVLMLGDEDAGAGDGGASLAGTIRRVLQLNQRLTERMDAHVEEKEKLAERIRQLERQGALGGGGDAVVGGAPAQNVRDLPGARPLPPAGAGGAVAAASSAIRGGLGILRDAVPLR